jgi:hypothetical protein
MTDKAHHVSSGWKSVDQTVIHQLRFVSSCLKANGLRTPNKTGQAMQNQTGTVREATMRPIIF